MRRRLVAPARARPASLIGLAARSGLVALPGLAVLLAAGGLLALPRPAVADACASVCDDPQQVAACRDERPVWGFREPGGVCRGGSFGYLESRDSADAERLRLAREYKRRCDASGDCERFEALDQAEVVCLACAPAPGPAPVSASGPHERSASGSGGAPGRPPPCEEDEWLQVATPTTPARCFVEFVGLPPRIALQGRCVQGDCRSGLGTLRWPTGESYVGSFRDGKRNGQGTFSWPDGRRYVGEWRDGQPGGLGTRIFANGRYKAGYFDRGRYLGADVDQVKASLAHETPRPAPAPTPENARSCEEVCTEDAELRLGRINDEYECCFARHAFCTQKVDIALDACSDRGCAEAVRQQREDCNLRYACDAVQTEKLARFRRGEAACIEGCSSQELDGQGLRISERGTLYDE